MPRLFFIAPDGEEGTQINVQSVGQGATRQLASAIEAGDLPAGALLPPGDFEGQMLFWDGTAWVPVPVDRGEARIGELHSVEPSSTRLVLDTDFAQLSAETSQLTDAALQSIVTVDATRFSCSYSDGVAPLVRVLGNADGMQLDAGAMGFFDKAPVARPTVTASDALVALNSLIAGLAALGLVEPVVVPQPAAVRVVGYTAAAPLVVELLPAGHDAGFYELLLAIVVRTAATAGTLTRTYQFSTPLIGAVQIIGFGPASIVGFTGPVAAGVTSVSAYSDGVNAITVTLTPTAITGAPVVDVTAMASFAGT